MASEVYEKMLRLLHPFMPFITEELWWQLEDREQGESIMRAEWPVSNPEEIDTQATELFSLIQEMISGIRNVKSRYGVGPGKEVAAAISAAGPVVAAGLEGQRGYFRSLARVSDLAIGVDLDRPKAAAAFVVGGHQVYVPLAGMIDLDVERDRLAKEIAQKEAFLDSVNRKLRNEQFTGRAPAEVVERERQKATDAGVELARHVFGNPLADQHFFLPGTADRRSHRARPHPAVDPSGTHTGSVAGDVTRRGSRAEFGGMTQLVEQTDHPGPMRAELLE